MNKTKHRTSHKLNMTVLKQQILDRLDKELRLDSESFQSRLKARYPILTAYDLRLCTYLKANLSTKEIATILNITPDSVKKAKHRLRKKLNASPDAPITALF